MRLVRASSAKSEGSRSENTTRQAAHALCYPFGPFGLWNYAGSKRPSSRFSRVAVQITQLRTELAPAPSRYIDRQRETGFPAFFLYGPRDSHRIDGDGMPNVSIRRLALHFPAPIQPRIVRAALLGDALRLSLSLSLSLSLPLPSVDSQARAGAAPRLTRDCIATRVDNNPRT